MAEFVEVMKQTKRMCKAHESCRECPMPRQNKEYSCPLYSVNSEVCEVEKVERIVMDWAEKHPEPRYPSWKEWHKANFPEALHDICPNFFMREKPLGTCAVSCEKCVSTPIRADIAEKLGIKPIGGGSDV